ncbi:MAG: hypothetical protein SYC29_08160 [Planctomycetota bacterium]|nr:hypothetical protein [Planctomycetota bacterium]
MHSRRAHHRIRKRAKANPRARRILVALLASLPLAGCAVHWYDEETGTEHILGFGHLKMKLAEPAEGVRAVVTGTETLGLAVRADDREGYFLIGWQKLSRLRAIDENTRIRFEWPDADVFNVRLGSEFPCAADEGDARPDGPPDKEAPS